MEDERLDDRNPEKDLMPEGMDSEPQQDTKSALEKTTAAMEFAVSRQPDTPEKPGGQFTS